MARGSGDPEQKITRSKVVVSGSPAGVITDVNVGLNLTHTYDPDLVITLISPSGTRVLLSANNGFEFPVVGRELHQHGFRRSGPHADHRGPVAVYRHSYPSAPLSQLIGEDPDGTWTLEVDDTLGIDIGTLLEWSLAIQVGTVTIDVVTGHPMDQNANGITGEPSLDSFAAPQ